MNWKCRVFFCYFFLDSIEICLFCVYMIGNVLSRDEVSVHERKRNSNHRIKSQFKMLNFYCSIRRWRASSPLYDLVNQRAQLDDIVIRQCEFTCIEIYYFLFFLKNAHSLLFFDSNWKASFIWIWIILCILILGNVLFCFKILNFVKKTNCWANAFCNVACHFAVACFNFVCTGVAKQHTQHKSTRC